LRDEDLIPVEKVSVPESTPVDRCTQAYAQHLREAQALAEATILNYVPFIHTFLKRLFGDGPVALSHLCASDVVQFVEHQAPRLHRKRAKLMTSALRSFLKYARYRGEVVLDLAAAVPVVASWSMPSIPRAISADQVSQLLVSIDQRTAIGCRDYAILLLFARLGLRLNEVAFLELDDIDWNTGTLNVRAKGGLHNEFPLPVEVGQAIAAYLQEGRPYNDSRRVSFCAPKLLSVVFEAPVALGQSFVIRSSALASRRRHMEHISFAMDWLPRCCAKGLLSKRSVTYWVIVIHRQR
jgi:site-specific recombinase XerC